MDKVDNKLITLVLVFFLSLGFFAVSIVSQQVFRARASKNVVPSAQTSILLAFPLSLKVGERATINCVARDDAGSAVPGKTCTISTSCGTISPSSEQTNVNGIAQFMLSSDSSCTAQLTATLDNSVQVSQTTSVQFTNQQ